MQRLLADCAAVRLEAAGPMETQALVLEGTAALKDEIWAIAKTLARDQPAAVWAHSLAALDEVSDLALSRAPGVRVARPQHPMGLLVWVSLLAVAGLGFQLGVLGSRNPPCRPC